MDLAALVTRYHNALNAFDPDVVRAMFAPGASYHSPSTGVKRGREVIIAAMTGYFAEYADQVAVDEEVTVLDGSRVRCVWRLKATSSVTGEPYVRQGVEIVTFDSAGLISKVEVEDR